jgi:hypothetical protein
VEGNPDKSRPVIEDVHSAIAAWRVHDTSWVRSCHSASYDLAQDEVVLVDFGTRVYEL